ncbi:hypothetical protein [Baekduia sp. Peel2402]|uniref:hypothetical protein n=1 Tax=Baekduia sp. Peel2402 TaxID=3458296 RepID=UPI00403E56E9
MSDHADLDALKDTFGVSPNITRQRAQSLSSALRTLWQAAFGQLPGELASDLELARKHFFDPVAQGKRLREMVTAIDASRGDEVPAELALEISARQTLITPEGRAMIAVLDEALTAEPFSVLSGRPAYHEHVLYRCYRDWGRHRLRQVIDLLGDDNLRTLAVGVLIALLVNRSNSMQRALPRWKEASERTAFDQAFFAAVYAFADRIDQRRRAPGKERLVGGWTLHEVVRRRPGALELNDNEVYVKPGREEDLISLAASALARSSDPTTVGDAFDALVDTLRKEAPILARYNAYYERDYDTKQLRDRLLESVANVR